MKIGNSYFEQEKLSQALHQYHLGMEASDSAFYHPAKVKILIAKANTLQMMYQAEQDSELLIRALRSYMKAAQMSDQIRISYSQSGSKLFLLDDIFPLYEGGIETACHLFNITGETQYIDMAFSFSEQSKAVLLGEALQNQRAREFGRIPDSVLAAERKFHRYISYFQEQIFKEQEKGKNKDEERILEWQIQLFQSQITTRLPVGGNQ